MRRFQWLRLPAALLVVAGCSNTHKAADAPTTTTSTNVATGSSTTGAITTTPTTVSTSGPLTAGVCEPGQLAISTPGANGAGGTGIYTFEVVNRASNPCQVGGYFGVSIYDPDGHLLTATATREPGNATEEGVQPITLQPGGTASFTITDNEIPDTGSTCPMIGAFHLTPPNATSSIQVSLDPSGHLYCSRPEVFPTQPRT
jgi:hypothetical protein